MNQTTTRARFSITGEYLTDVSRDLVLSERPADAWRLITSTLIGGKPGEAEAVARGILTGTSKLTGDSSEGIGVADEDAGEVECYLRDFRYIYAGRVKIKGAWYRPRAEVVQYGPDDAAHASSGSYDEDDHPTKNLKSFWRARVAYYLNEGEIVVEVKRHDKPKRSKGNPDLLTAPEGFLIFEPVGEAPFWMKENRSADDALSDFFAAGRKLDQIHASSGAGSRYTPEDGAPASAQKARLLADIQAERDEEDDRREREFHAKCADIAEKVRAQAGGDVFTLKTKSGREIVVPRAPFWHWALARTSLKHLAPPWEVVSPSGMKLQMDEPSHTDWMLGAGLNLVKDYDDREISNAAHNEMYEIQTSLSEFNAAVILPGKGLEVMGEVGKLIAVVPNLDEDQLPHVMNALAIVTETGGALAHVSLFAIEREVPILMVPDAVQRFPIGTKLLIQPSTGEVNVRYDRR